MRGDQKGVGTSAPEVLVEPAVQQGVAAGGGHGEAVAAGEADVVPAVTA